MRAPGLMALVVCLLAVGAGSARLAAAKPESTIAVTVNGLGCSTAVGANSFEASSWSWGASNTVTDPSGGGGGAGKAVVSALSLTRLSDACSPALLGGVMTGRFFQTLTLTQYDGGGAMTATVVLNDVTIAEWRIGGTGAAAAAAEQVQVSFNRFTFTDVASGNKFCFDLAAGKGC